MRELTNKNRINTFFFRIFSVAFDLTKR